MGRMQICTSLRQITMPAHHRSVFYRPDALPVAQPSVKALKQVVFSDLHMLTTWHCRRCMPLLQQLIDKTCLVSPQQQT